MASNASWTTRLILAGLSVMLTIGGPPPAAALPATCETPLDAPPAVYLGAWVPAARDDPRLPLAQDPLGHINHLASKPMAIVLRWEHWGLENDGGVDLGWLRRVVEAGALPMLTWDPWDPTLDPPDTQQGFLLRGIAAGAHDAYIVATARTLAAWDGPLFLRFAQEMNGNWYPWGRHQNHPDEYIAAWRHVHQLFQQHGAGHVTWVWNVSEKNHPESLSLWYPGDDVVDWVAVDGYNFDDPAYWHDPARQTWRTLDQVFGRSFADLASFVPPDKPRMIAETASTERPIDPELKPNWTCDAFRRALPEVLPEVRAVLWFDEDKTEAGHPFAWRVESSPAHAEAFRAAVSPAYFVGGHPELARGIGRARIPPP